MFSDIVSEYGIKILISTKYYILRCKKYPQSIFNIITVKEQQMIKSIIASNNMILRTVEPRVWQPSQSNTVFIQQ